MEARVRGQQGLKQTLNHSEIGAPVTIHGSVRKAAPLVRTPANGTARLPLMGKLKRLKSHNAIQMEAVCTTKPCHSCM